MRHTRRALFVGSLVLTFGRSGLAQDTVLDCNAHAATAIVGVATHVPPQAVLRLAMVHVAIYDAVNAIEGYPFTPYAVRPSVSHPASPEAAAATAAHDVLVSLLPAQQPALDEAYAASIAMIADGPAKTHGISVGQQVASGILTLRANDGRDATVTYTPGSGPGVWIPTPPGFLAAQAPEMSLVRPWTLRSPSQFRAERPPTLTSGTWVRNYNEVKQLGPATGSTRTPAQTDLARFVSDNPVLQWNRAWRGISIAQGLSLPENARFLALLTTASSDALIACWDSKFFYNFWRPATAIRAGDVDGNPKTEPDPAWIGVVVTPNHPEYPAAHGCFSAASTETLKFFFGTDRLDFTIDSLVAGLTDPVRSYGTFSQALIDILDARIYGGMHYRISTRVGAKMGRRVARVVTRDFFRRSNDADDDAAADDAHADDDDQ